VVNVVARSVPLIREFAEMGPRRETRREYEAFKALLAGKTAAERLRLTAEHRAYLASERDTDVLIPGQAQVLRPVRLPPVGKSAAYIAALRSGMDESDEGQSEEEMEFKDAVVEDAEEVVGATKTKAKGKRKRKTTAASKKTTDEKTAAREAKKAKEAAAVARAASAASKKKMAQDEGETSPGEGGETWSCRWRWGTCSP
jgi:hypothetical protein